MHPAGNEEALLHWLIAWLWVDGSAAWQFVESLVAERDETPSHLVMSLAAALGGRLWPGRGIEGADFLRPDVLERMIRVVYAHVHPDDDLGTEGPHRVETRENAQEFWRWMPQFLAEQPGQDAQDALQSLAADLEPESKRPWIRNLAEKQAAKAIEYLPWAPSDVAEFGAVYEKAPTSAGDIFEIVRDRLNDIKEDIERGDFSDRGLFYPGMREYLIQRWLAGRLERESRGRYSVVREEEVDRREETDIRLHSPTAGLVTVEVKPVERGTGRYPFNQLVSALEDQLVGQYLRAAGSRHGILVVAMLEQRQWNPRDGAGRIDFLELIERLNTRAQAIAETDDRVEALRVIGIDFTYGNSM